MPTAIVVDDSRAIRMILSRTLRELGYQVGEAGNGREALETIGRTASVDLVMADWNMPEMSGIDFLVQVRASAIKVPFGFITSEASTAIKELAMKSGASFLITKPFSPETMQEALSPILGKC